MALFSGLEQPEIDSVIDSVACKLLLDNFLVGFGEAIIEAVDDSVRRWLLFLRRHKIY